MLEKGVLQECRRHGGSRVAMGKLIAVANSRLLADLSGVMTEVILPLLGRKTHVRTEQTQAPGKFCALCFRLLLALLCTAPQALQQHTTCFSSVCYVMGNLAGAGFIDERKAVPSIKKVLLVERTANKLQLQQSWSDVYTVQ
ncbi:hypothetical protein TREES_T100007261 [Tupaia chinensis]|uniref:Uncharacterized protein n=1 Tax=Tupaia chinensis TaxID=246437 RepID=L9L1U1_TUPCH|nr:hypothetical protein TREES_T100007261 [Tupaia chinensis]